MSDHIKTRINVGIRLMIIASVILSGCSETPRDQRWQQLQRMRNEWQSMYDSLTAEQKAAWERDGQEYLDAVVQQSEEGEILFESEEDVICMMLAEHWSNMVYIETELKKLGMTDAEIKQGTEPPGDS